MKKNLYFSLISVVLLLVLSSVVYAEVSTSSEVGKSKNGDRHRSEVSKVVQELNGIADRDTSIGNEIRVVAQEQKDLAEKVKDQMNAVETRGGFKTFLIGADYKNLGVLRSEIVTTENHLSRLNKVFLASSTTRTTRIDVEKQIKELSGVKTKAEAFVKSMEGKFSLFGWLVRMFQ